MLNNMNVLEQIFMIATAVTESDLEKLTIEEELLLKIVKTSKHSLNVKTAALDRIARINEKQLALLRTYLKGR